MPVRKTGYGVSSHQLASGVSSHQLASGYSAHSLGGMSAHTLGGKRKIKKMATDLMKAGNIISTVAHSVGDIADLFGFGKRKAPPKKRVGKGLVSTLAHGVGDVADLFGLGKPKRKPAKKPASKRTIRGGASVDLFQ